MKRKILSLFLVMAVLTTIFAVPTYADPVVYDVSVNGDGSVTATYDPDTYTMTISGTGAMKDYNNKVTTDCVPYYNKLASMKKIVVEEGITHIGTNAFYAYYSYYNDDYWANKVTELSLPSTLESIGAYAFKGLGRSAETFNLVIPEGVTLIDNHAFISAFNESTSATISLPTTLKTIGGSAFSSINSVNEIIIPEGVETLGESAFYSMSGLKRITIPSTVTTIGSNAFKFCTSVENIEYNAVNASLGSTIFGVSATTGTKMGENATDKTATVHKSQRYIIESLTSFGYEVSTFGEESSDVSASYPSEYVWSVGAEGDNIIALYNDTTKTLYLEGSGEMKDYTYYHWNSTNNEKVPYQYFLSGIKSIVMDDDITHIGSYTFFTKDVGRTNSTTSPLNVLESIKFPKNLKSIGAYAFNSMNAYYKEYTVDIILPEGLLSIGESAFAGAYIRTLVVPSTILELDSGNNSITVINKIMTDQPDDVAKIVGNELYLYSTNTSLLTAAQETLDSDKIHFLDNPATSGVLENGITWTYDPDTQTLTFDTTNATSTEIPSYSVGYQPWYACSYHYGAPRTYGFGGVTGIGSGALMGLDYGSVGNIDYYGNSSLGGAITSQTGVPTTYGGSSNPNTDSDLGGSGDGGSTGDDTTQDPSTDTSETGIWVYVDDVEVDFPDVQPRVWFGEVYAPLRFINQDLGAKVLWNNESRTATIQRTTANGSKVEIELTVGSSSMVVNGKEYTSEEIGMEATVLFENGRLLLPGRAIVKAWDDVFFKNVYTATAYKDYYYYQDDGESEDKLEEVPEIDNFVSNGVEITPDNEEEVLSDYGETKILVNAESTFFFVSTPILVSVYMDSIGNVAVSDNLYIENKCASGPVVIEEIKIIKANQWVLRNYTTFDFKNALADSKFIGLEINGVTVGEDGSVIMNEDLYSSILHSESKELEINAKLPAQRKAIKEIGAGIIFTVDFDKYGE